MAANDQDKYLLADEDGNTRCWWCGEDPEYQRYHDEEWGFPVDNDFRLFEKISLEGFQSGLSWLTILRKREHFREAFAHFDFNAVAEFDEGDVERLLGDKGIVRHRGKILATINNARRAIELVTETGSLAAYVWNWEPKSREPEAGKVVSEHKIPTMTATSIAMSRDLKKRGWKFFGPTTCYAFMQAMGLVNDHLTGCDLRAKVEKVRESFVRPS